MLEKGNTYDFPVKEIRTENKRSFYIIEAEGKEYAIGQFEFQKSDPKPEKISCLVKDIHEDTPVIIQNFAPLLQRLYTVGNIYPFWVRKDCTQIPNGYYEVADWNGFYFRLLFHRNAKLHIRQRIECRVKSLRDYRLCLELVQSDVKQDSLPFLTFEEIFENIGATAPVMRWIKRIFLTLPLLKEAREAYLYDNREWALLAIDLLDKHLGEWAVLPRRGGLLLDLYHQSCLYLLEDSDFLRDCTDIERVAHQQLLSQTVQHAEEYAEAIGMIGSDEHIRYIDTLLGKMQKSGYLYQPERKLKVLMCIFSMNQELMEQKMPALFQVIQEGNKENWQTEPFRSAFIRMLELFIENSRLRIDHMANIEEAEGRECLEKMITALAIQLLLATEKDSFDRQVCHSMLYRYLTYMKGSNPEVLLNKAFRCLSETQQEQLEFGWREVRDLTLLTIRLSSPSAYMASKQTNAIQSYDGKKVQLRIVNGDIRLFPSDESRNLRPCLPATLLPWHHINILLPESRNFSPQASDADITAFRTLWREVEYELFHNTDYPIVRRTDRKLRPEQGDKVTIRILRQDPANSEYFLCRIEDDLYEGEGKINVRNFVRYNLRMDISAFCNDMGKPYLLKAEVMSIGQHGTYNFNMQPLIDDFVYQNEAVGKVIQCLVTEPIIGNYLCVSDFGYSVYIPMSPDMPELKPGDYVEAEVNEVRSNGSVYADFLRQVVGMFDVQDVFADLINSYAEERVYEEEDEEKELQYAEVMMEDTYVNELIHIIDRVAVLDKNLLNTYNYLGVARILSIMLKEENQAQYYTERMKLLYMLQQFAINGQVDEEKLKEQARINSDILPNYPLLRNRLLELETISYLERPERNPFLWETATTAGNERLGKIARLVLSYNLLAGFDMYEQKEIIRQKINETLNLVIQREALKYFGREDQHTEFKTSVVYPADNGMRPDLQKQTLEIMKVICGFLNTEGGTLYLGVNNEGVASGLESDIEFFGGSSDKFDLHVRNSIVQYMGTDANARVAADCTLYGKRLVYTLNIKPTPHPTMCEGIYYLRQGSSTWPLLNEGEISAFLQRRKAECSVELMAAPAEPPAADPVPVPAPAPVEEVAAPAEPEKPLVKYHDEETILTSQLRLNATHSWEEGYGEDTVCYLHLLPNNSYLLTDDECWRNDILLSLAIHESEADGYLVLVFDSCRIVRIPVSELLDKTIGKEYKRYSKERVVFACPVRKDDALLSVMADVQGRPCYRLDDVKNLKQGTMMTKGELLSNVETNGVMQCEVLAHDRVSPFKRIHNLKYTYVGLNLNALWGSEELEEIRKMGIRLLFEK